jgi:hypothetical protein
MSGKENRETAQQTFRQFAWHLAGTLADKQGKPAKSPTQRSGAGAKR